MKSKLNYLIGVSLKRKVKTKWFVLANVILAIVIVALINIDSIITFFGGDFNTVQTVYIIDHTGKVKEELESQIASATATLYGEDYVMYALKDYEGEDIRKTVEEEKDTLALIFEEDPDNIFSAKMISKEYMDLTETQILNLAMNNVKTSIALRETDIPIEEINKIYNPVSIERIYLDEEKNSEEENMNMIVTTAFPIFILPFFMLTLFLVQMIGAEVNDEKSTRGMEIIISNVSPKTHFFAKVIAGILFVFLQGGFLILFAILGMWIRKLIGGNTILNGVAGEVAGAFHSVMNSSIGASLIYIVPLTILLMVLTFIAYALLAGILASMTTNTEDFQQLQTPIIIISLIGYYLAMMAGMFKGALFIKIVSFMPLISAILAPSLLLLGQIGLVEVVIAVLLMIGFIYLLIKYGLRIYKVGILNYSSQGLWKKMFKALKAK